MSDKKDVQEVLEDNNQIDSQTLGEVVDLLVVDAEEIKAEETKEIEIVAPTYASLDAIAYQKLEAEFTRLDIPSAWKPGTKKKNLIENALREFQLVSQIKADGFAGADILAELKKRKDAIKQNKAGEKLKAELAAQSVDKKEVEELKSQDIDTDKIELIISRIQGRLSNCISSHRPILLKELAKYEALLADKKKAEA